MANVKFSEFTPITTPAEDDEFVGFRAGANIRTPASALMIAGTKVPDATGSHVTDTANILAAFTAAGTGGVVIFPPGQTYRTYRKPGTITTLPRLVLGNGSTLKARNEVTTTLTGGPYSAGATSITVTSATGFSAGDYVMMANASGYIYPTYISNVVGNTLTVTAITFASGSSVTAGDSISTCDSCLTISAAAEGDCEITGLTFDGNEANRTTNRRWTQFALMDIAGGGATYTPKVWVHHNIFINGPNDGLGAANIAHLSVTDNHFETIYGNGFHPGSSVSDTTKECIFTGNTLTDVYKFTSATTPTCVQYGHLSGHGAIVSSLGAKRYVVANNTVNGSKGYGFDGVNNASTTHIAVTGNVFRNCSHGGFRAETASGTKASFTGNILESCGQSTSADTGTTFEVTKISGCTGADMVVANNVFDNSIMAIQGSTSQLVVANNVFNFVTKGYAGSETAAIVFGGSPCKDVTITGNLFRGPRTNAELTTISDLPLDCILLSQQSNLAITNNVFVGGRMGVRGTGNNINGALISGNTFKDQISNTGTNSHGVHFPAATTMTGVSVVNNVISRENDTTGAWIGIEFGLMTTTSGCLVANNVISSSVTGTHTGINLGSNTGTGLSVIGNVVQLFDTGDTAISGGSLATSSKVMNNVFAGTSAPDLASAGLTVSMRQSISSATAIRLSATLTVLNETVGGYAITLAAPTDEMSGQVKVIQMIASAGADVTLALTNVVGGTGGTTTATFNAVNECLTLVACGTKWMVTGQAGVTIT